jgi:hypothetical protein
MFCEGFFPRHGTNHKIHTKSKELIWSKECQDAWEIIKQKYVVTPILISLNWDKEFDLHISTFNLVVVVMMAQNMDVRCYQLITYAPRLLNMGERNYMIIKWEALTMVYAFHKFHLYLLGEKNVFYVYHMALTHLVSNHNYLVE